jgi:hypothetical protein
MLAPFAAALALGAVACGAGAQDGETPKTPKTETTEEPPQMGDASSTIDVYCTPPGKVLIDGKPAGTAPLKMFKVEPGSHDVTCVDETGNRTMGVNVAPGESRSVISDRPINAGK